MKSNEVAVIENLLHEHEAIRACIRSASALITEQMPGEVTRTDRSKELTELMRLQMNLGEILRSFEEGLKQHHRYEEETMPALLGDLLTGPILIEHTEMVKELGDINCLLSDVNPEGVIIDKKYIRVIIDSFVSWVVDHCNREDRLFEIVVKEFAPSDSHISSVLF